MNKYKILTDWFKDNYVPSFDWVFFNVVVETVDNISFTSVPNVREVERYIDGSRVVEMLFSIVLCKEFDGDNTSDVNVNALQEFENIANWIEEKNINREYPEFGDKFLIEEIASLENAPSVIVDSKNNIARYSGQFKITYIEEV